MRPRRRRDRRRDARRRLPTIGRVGLAMVGAFVVVGVVGPSVAGYDPQQMTTASLEAPSRAHALGTNFVGQDLASQLLHGARTSLLVATLAAAGTITLATLVGVTAGWVGGVVDVVLMRFVDVMLATPRLPLLIVLGTLLGNDVSTVALVMALVFWPGPSRMIRGQVRSLRERLHVRAARSFGAGSLHLVRRHVLPEVSLILAASLVATAGRAVLFEAGLAFLGIGDPFRTSWGQTLARSRRVVGLYYSDAWVWWVIPPIVCMVVVLLGFTFISMGLEDRVNPRVARHAGRARRPTRLPRTAPAPQH